MDKSIGWFKGVLNCQWISVVFTCLMSCVSVTETNYKQFLQSPIYVIVRGFFVIFCHIRWLLYLLKVLCSYYCSLMDDPYRNLYWNPCVRIKRRSLQVFNDTRRAVIKLKRRLFKIIQNYSITRHFVKYNM